MRYGIVMIQGVIMNKEDCKCFLSVDLKMVPNGNKVGDIGTMVVEKVNRHNNSMCKVHNSSGTVPTEAAVSTDNE